MIYFSLWWCRHVDKWYQTWLFMEGKGGKSWSLKLSFAVENTWHFRQNHLNLLTAKILSEIEYEISKRNFFLKDENKNVWKLKNKGFVFLLLKKAINFWVSEIFHSTLKLNWLDFLAKQKYRSRIIKESLSQLSLIQAFTTIPHHVSKHNSPSLSPTWLGSKSLVWWRLWHGLSLKLCHIYCVINVTWKGETRQML